MKKRDAAKLFGGTQSALARALQVSRQRIHQLPEDLPTYYQDRVVGAAHRLGISLPVELLVEHRNVGAGGTA